MRALRGVERGQVGGTMGRSVAAVAAGAALAFGGMAGAYLTGRVEGPGPAASTAA